MTYGQDPQNEGFFDEDEEELLRAESEFQDRHDDFLEEKERDRLERIEKLSTRNALKY